MTVCVTDPSQPPTCRLALLKEPRKDRQGNVRTICNLSIDLSEEVSREVCLAIFGFIARVTSRGSLKWRACSKARNYENVIFNPLVYGRAPT